MANSFCTPDCIKMVRTEKQIWFLFQNVCVFGNMSKGNKCSFCCFLNHIICFCKSRVLLRFVRQGILRCSTHFSYCHCRFNRCLFLISHCKFNAVCFLYYLRHGNINDSQATNWTSTHVEKIYVCERAERVSLEMFSLQCLSWYLYDFVCIIWTVWYFVIYICAFIAVSLLYITHDMAL